jgi:hypothetical protein
VAGLMVVTTGHGKVGDNLTSMEASREKGGKSVRAPVRGEDLEERWGSSYKGCGNGSGRQLNGGGDAQSLKQV